MKKELRKRIVSLIVELEAQNIQCGRALELQVNELFQMLYILIDEDTFALVREIWDNRYEGIQDEVDKQIYKIMQFDREIKGVLAERKYI